MGEITDITPDPADMDALRAFASQAEGERAVAWAVVAIKSDGAVSTAYSIAGGRAGLGSLALIGAVQVLERTLDGRL